ncbi:MAG: diacylglycerol kinase family protein [Pseudomonadota bacterium]|nr:diacylglycerol kinase family protein [Pseudomonadota bacterium]
MSDSPSSTDSAGAQNRGERLIVIANPKAGGGRAGANRDLIERAAARAFAQVEVRWTEGPGHASELARDAAADADIVAALGGDGTCSEVVNGLVPGGVAVKPKVVFGVIPFGTGGDLVRSLELPRKVDRAYWMLGTGMTLPLDIGLFTWDDGAKRVFVNVAGIGANADVCRRANASSKRFGGTVTFLSAVVGALAGFEARRVSWSWDGPDGPGEAELDTFAAFCANGHYCGAGMWVGKGGSMADGVFELTIIPPFGLMKALSLLPHVYNGKLADRPEVRRIRVTSVRVGSEMPLEGDGESLGSGPVRITSVPRALQMRGGWLNPPRGGASSAR